MTRRLRALPADTPTNVVTGDGRTVRVRLVAWDTPSSVTDDGGRTWYREAFARGGLQVPGDAAEVVLPASAGHHRETVGRIVEVEDLDDGLYAEIRMDEYSTAADRELARIDRGELSVSVEFDDFDGDATPGSTVTRTDAVLTGVAFTDLPQHSTAAVIGRRSHEGTTMDNDQDQQAAGTATDAPTTTPPAPTPATTSHDRGHDRPDPTPPTRRTGAAGQPVASRFRSFGEFVHAAARGAIDLEERQRYYRALASASTADTTMQVQWINEVIDLVRASQPMVNAFSSRPLPIEGETVSQPVVTQRPTVARQVAQGDAISSTKVIIGPASWPVLTYGGGQGMSIQTVLRSTPSYLNEVMRLYSVEAALELEEVVAAGVLDAANDVHTAIELDASGTGTLLVDAFIDGAARILSRSTGLGRMPEVVVGNVPMWVLLAKAKDSTGRPLFPGISPLNPVGRLDLTTPDGEVRGLQFACSPSMPTVRAQAVMGVRDAYRTMVGPMQTLQADVPETLTQERAVFQFAAHGKVDARGLVLIDNAS